MATVNLSQFGNKGAPKRRKAVIYLDEKRPDDERFGYAPKQAKAPSVVKPVVPVPPTPQPVTPPDFKHIANLRNIGGGIKAASSMPPAGSLMDMLKSNKLASAVVQQPLNTIGKITAIPSALKGMADKFNKEQELNRLLKFKQRGEISEADFVNFQKPILTPYKTELEKKLPTSPSGISKMFLSEAQKGRENVTNGLNGLAKTAANLAFGVGDLGTDVAISGMTGIPLTNMFGVTGGAQAAQRTLDEGRSSGEALLFGVGSGLITKAVEGLGGIGGNATTKALLKPFQPLLNKAPAKLSSFLQKASGSKLGQWLGSAASEGMEEGVEYNAQRLLENIMLDKDVPFDIKQMSENMLYGAAMGGIFGGAKLAPQAIRDGAASYKNSLGNVYGMKPGEQVSKSAAPMGAIGGYQVAQAQKNTVINDSVAGHTEQQNKVISEYKSAVDTNLTEYIETVRANPNNRYMNFTTTPVSETEAVKIKGIVGVDVTGFEHNIKPSAIQHIDKRHGKNGIADHSMENVEDMARINYVVNNFDSIQPSLDEKGQQRYSDEFKNSDGTRAKTILLSKAIDGTFYVVEAVPDSKAKKLQLVSAYINKKGAYQVPDTRQMALPRHTSENELEFTPYDPIIPQRNNSVNTHSMQDSRKNAKQVASNKAPLDFVKTDEQMRYTKQVDDWQAGKLKNGERLTLGKTPSVFTDLGAKNYPLIITQETMSKVVKPVGTDNGKHDLGIDIMKQLPSQLENPLLVFKSATRPNDSMVAVTNVLDKQNREVIVAVRLDFKDGFTTVNKISSAYGRNKAVEFLKREIENGNLLYSDKEKAAEWLHSRGLQLPKENTISDLSNPIIPRGNNSVNTHSMQDSGKNAVLQSTAKDSENLYAVNQDFIKTTSAVHEVAQKAHQFVISGQAPIERMSKANGKNNPSIEAALQLSRQAGGTVDHIAEKGLASRDGKKTLLKSYKKLMEEIPKGHLSKFNDYAQNLHNIDRMSIEERAVSKANSYKASNPELAKLSIEEIQKLATAKDGSGVSANEYLNLVERANTAKNKPVNANTAEQSAAIVEKYELENPQFKKISEDINNWWDTFGREWTVGSGLMSEGNYNAMREMYPNYIPTFRVDKQGGFGRGVHGKAVTTPKVIKKAVGGTSEIIPLEESFMAQIDRTVKAARRNELYQSIADFAVLQPEDAAKLGVKLSQSSGSTFDFDSMDGFLDDMDMNTLKQLKEGGYQLTVLDKGKPISLDISREVWDGLRWLQDNGMSESFLNAFVNLGKKFTSPTKAVTTGINALFAITNTVRDNQSYFINSISNSPLKLVSNYAKAIRDVLVQNDLYHQYTALGGSRSGFYGQQAGFKGSLKTPFKELSTGKKVTKVLTSPMILPFKAIGKLGEFTEKVPRMAEFRNGIEKYGNTSEGLKKASFAAADVTVNFSRNAPITKVADAWTMYLNAQVQGLDKTVRQIKERPIATLTKGVIAITLPTLLLQLLNADNPYYDELDNRTKDGYFVIPNVLDLDEDGKSKTFIKLPKSREWGVVLGASFDRIAQYMETGDLKESFRGFGQTLASSYAPTDFTTGNIFAPITQNIPSNKDWAGRSIVPLSMENLEPRQQYDINTSGIAKNIGQALNLSPKQIDYLINSYGGYPGDLLQGLTSLQNKGETPLETAKNAVGKAIVEPFERRFIGNPLYSSAVVDKFYNDLDKAKKAAASKSFTENLPSEVVTPEDKKVSYLNKISLQMSDLRKQEKEILGETISGQEKKLKTDEIRRQINDLAKNAESEAQSEADEYAKKYVSELSMLSDKMQEDWWGMKASVSAKVFKRAYTAQKDVEGDKDSNGKTLPLSASKNKKAAIDAATPGMSSVDRKKLYAAFGVSEKVW